MQATKNVVLITIDSLRADHLGCYGYNRNTSPFIDHLASEATLFTQAISAGGGTPEAFPSILSSTLAPLDGDFTRDVERVTIAQVLKSAGYNTAGFHSNPYLSRYYHYERGFDTFFDGIVTGGIAQNAFSAGIRDRLRAKLQRNRRLLLLWDFWYAFSSRRVPYLQAGSITDKAISWLKSHPSKSFLWLHFMDTHHPYLPPREFLEQFNEPATSNLKRRLLMRKMLRQPGEITPLDVSLLINAYDASIRYVDAEIARFFHELSSILQDALVVIMADHGEEFGEHGRFSHTAVYENLIHVPLLIWSGNEKRQHKISAPVSSLGLPPTVLDYLGLPVPPGFTGQSYLSQIKGAAEPDKVIVSVSLDPVQGRRTMSCRIRQWKYIETEIGTNAHNKISKELYNLAEDPDEQINLAGQPQKLSELEASLAGYLEVVRRQSAADEKERIRTKLRSLRSETTGKP